MKKNIVKVIKSMQNNFVQTITPKLEDGVLKFEATLGNGTKEMVSDEWLKGNIGTELDRPEGHIDMFLNCEMDDSAGLEMNRFGSLGTERAVHVWKRFGQGTYC
eukprot:7924805-Ditylum_brightwellii.AAC.1